MNDHALQITSHAALRLAQRGFRVGDAEWIMAVGTPVEGGYLVRTKDIELVEREMKSLLTRLRRLEGTRVVIDGDHVVTAYHPRPGKERQLLRARRRQH